MGRTTQATSPRIDKDHVEAYLHGAGYPDARVLSLDPLGETGAGELKTYGYGLPLRIHFASGGTERDLVLRTMAPDPFGHDRRADRAAVLLLAYDVFETIPRHIHALDVGAFDEDGALVPMARGEIFLVSDYVEGRLYAADLAALGGSDLPQARDLARAEALARYLVELHAAPADPDSYRRHLRDTVGSGEGIFGLCDSYPEDHPVASTDRLQRIELAAVPWRWRLRHATHRARRTHGDFHPFNILFREGSDFSVLDASRGGAGDPADDVVALAINYLFFSLTERGRFEDPYRALWERFFEVYLDASGDRALLEVVAPYFAWRGLVVASPVWYPSVSDRIREMLLTLVERLLLGAEFHPHTVDRLLE